MTNKFINLSNKIKILRSYIQLKWKKGKLKIS